MLNNNLKFWKKTLWFSIDEICKHFNTTPDNASNLLMQIYASKELSEKDVSVKNKKGELFLNLDAAISIGYRINNFLATKFRMNMQDKLLELLMKHKKNETNKSDSLIPAHGGYKQLKSYQLTVVIYDATVVFCERYISCFSRTVDQMVQAARSGKQNIAEGSQASATSKKTEIKLINVARSSLQELLEDYEDYLRQNNLEIWEKNNPEALKVRKLAYKSNKTYSTYKKYFESGSSEIFANTVLTIIHQANYLLDKHIASLDKSFLESGGFTENLYKKRVANRRKNKNC